MINSRRLAAVLSGKSIRAVLSEDIVHGPDAIPDIGDRVVRRTVDRYGDYMTLHFSGGKSSTIALADDARAVFGIKRRDAQG